MALARDETVVIKSLDFKEADKILTLFGRKKGRFAVIAKGIRKMVSKNRGNMQTLALSKIAYYEGKSLGILRETELIVMPDFTEIDTMAMQRVLIMLNKMLPEDQPELRVFERLKALLLGEFDMERVNKFRFLFLMELGLLPDSKSCFYTGDEKVEFFEPATLAMVSQSAMDKGLVDSGEVVASENLNYGGGLVTEALDRYIDNVISA